MIPISQPFIEKKDFKYIKKVLENKILTDGFFQKKCENFIKKKLNSKFIALTHSCTAALEISAILINLKQGDEVSLNGDKNRAVVCIRTKIKEGTAVVYCGDNELDRHAMGDIVTLNKCANEIGGRGIQGLIVSDLYEETY